MKDRALPAAHPRLNPFLFPSETTFRFILLFVALSGAILFIYHWLYFRVPALKGQRLWAILQCAEALIINLQGLQITVFLIWLWAFPVAADLVAISTGERDAPSGSVDSTHCSDSSVELGSDIKTGPVKGLLLAARQVYAGPTPVSQSGPQAICCRNAAIW
jgi:hypothetical protein